MRTPCANSTQKEKGGKRRGRESPFCRARTRDRQALAHAIQSQSESDASRGFGTVLGFLDRGVLSGMAPINWSSEIRTVSPGRAAVSIFCMAGNSACSLGDSAV